MKIKFMKGNVLTFFKMIKIKSKIIVIQLRDISHKTFLREDVRFL